MINNADNSKKTEVTKLSQNSLSFFTVKSHTLQAYQLASQLERQYGLVQQQGKAEGIFSTADTKAELPPASVPEQSDILISKCNRPLCHYSCHCHCSCFAYMLK